MVNLRKYQEDNITNRGYNRQLGQFFTPNFLVEDCKKLIKNINGRLLEPSCGNGAFNSCKNANSVFIEIDKNIISDPDVLNIDFFDYPIEEKFDTIIGNPPYVDNAFISPAHKSKITVQANLYLFFIEKCVHHLKPSGELIFIVPRDFIKATSAKVINELLFEEGTITHFYDYGDQKIFEEASLNVCVFRFEKGNFSRKTITFNGEKNFLINNGIISFTDTKNVEPLGNFFKIKVGAVSGKDKLFEHEDGIDFVYSKTAKTGELRKLIYNEYHPCLEQYKTKLLARKIKNFSEDNWWGWGRPIKFYEGKPRIYVNCKTRNPKPFFTNKCDRWDGSILALFPNASIDMKRAVDILNSIDWAGLGFVSGGRFLFSQKALKEALIDGRLFK